MIKKMKFSREHFLRLAGAVSGAGVFGGIGYITNYSDYKKRYTIVPTHILIPPTVVCGALGGTIGYYVHPLTIGMGATFASIVALIKYFNWADKECKRANEKDKKK
jgi:hypothetical protein